MVRTKELRNVTGIVGKVGERSALESCQHIKYQEEKLLKRTQLAVSTLPSPSRTAGGTLASFLDQNHILMYVEVRSMAYLSL